MYGIEHGVETRKRLIIRSKVYNKLFHYINSTPLEVSGFGRTKQRGDSFEVVDVKIFKQECSSGGTTLKQDALVKFLSKIIKDGGKPEEYNLWWHSHVDFNAYFSHIDTSTIAELSENTTLVALCMNQFGDMVARKDGPSGHRVLHPVVLADGGQVRKNCKREVKRKVSEEVFRSVAIRQEYKIYSPVGFGEFGIITV